MCPLNHVICAQTGGLRLNVEISIQSLLEGILKSWHGGAYIRVHIQFFERSGGLVKRKQE